MDNIIDKMIYEIIDFIQSTKEIVTVKIDDNPKELRVGYKASYIKDGITHSINPCIRLSQLRNFAGTSFVYNSLGLNFANMKDRIKFCSIFNNTKSWNELLDAVQMHRALQ